MGDGCVLPHQPIHYTSADTDCIQAVSGAATRLFDITPRLVPQKNWFHIYLPSPYRLARGRRHPITRWYERLCIGRSRSYDKELPINLFTLPADKICLFLHHLWATDGNISWKYLPGRKPAGAIYYSTTSPVLAEQVQHLLLRLSIIGVLRKIPQGQYRPSYQIHIQGSVQQLRFCRLVGSFGMRGIAAAQLIDALGLIAANTNVDTIPREIWSLMVTPEKNRCGIGWREFVKRIDTAYCGSTLFKTGISRVRMARIADALNSTTLLDMAQSDLFWDEVASVSSLGLEDVFDMTMPENHNFVANDFIVHNSIEQDADVVMFIYREDKDRQNSDRANIADIMIEKHRNGPTGKIELYFHEETTSFRSIEKGRDDPLDIPL